MSTVDAIEPSPAPEAVPTRRNRHIRWPRYVDYIMKQVITLGGVGVTLAFATIFVFLVWVAIPLFKSTSIQRVSTITLGSAATAAVPASQAAAKPLAMEVDENHAALWVLREDATLTTYRVEGGEAVSVQELGERRITAVTNNHGVVAVGYDDGRIQVGRIAIGAEFSTVDKHLGAAALGTGQTLIEGDAIIARSVSERVRVLRTVPDLSDPLPIGTAGVPVTFIDYFQSDRQEGVLALQADGKLSMAMITKKENALTGEIKRTVEEHTLPVPANCRNKTAVAVMLGLNGRLGFVAYADGTLLRFNTDDLATAFLAEVAEVLPTKGTTLATVRMLLGNLTLIVADSAGNVAGWFPAPTNDRVAYRDGLHMVEAHKLGSQEGAITAITASARDRQFVTADDKGNLILRHMTSGTIQGKVHLEDSAAVLCAAIAPKNDGLAILDARNRLTFCSVANPHPDGSLVQLFLPIHYEGYPEARHVYQSSAGTDDAETKLGLTALVFGTLKATFYAMLFGVPIAILAALFTSEFMQPRMRAAVKPTIELMASLPSVVLGFIGALVIAPFVEKHIMAVFLSFVTLPLGFILAGYLWQLIPGAEHWSSAARFLISLVLPVPLVLVAVFSAHSVESALFSGDLKGWLTGHVGSATPGTALMLLPFVLVGVFLAFQACVRPRLAVYKNVRSDSGLASLEIARFFVLVVAAALLCWGLAIMLTWMGFDPRGSLLGPYVQRNSFLVGILMGFAIIPIIYSVSEDALSRVPVSLRSASLALGATRWQTAISVVFPVAMSGIFSACMIGFGRAVGETMIVLMVSGRTPIMDMSPFNGLSALSANIATELPEAPVNSTHYRVLFFSALVLFVMTFVVNTAAEVVRMRFRKSAAAL